jgi:hypothetical protein
MTSKFNQRWMMAGAIWATAILISFWNFSKIDAVTTMRESSERLRKEYLFQHRNAEKLLQVQNLYQSYYKPVASLKLGFESARGPLHSLAALFGLKNVHIESQMALASHDQIPFSMRMTGDHRKATGFAAALLKYPYISMERSRIKVFNREGIAEIEMELKFQFKIEPPKQMGSGSLQASILQEVQEVQRQ